MKIKAILFDMDGVLIDSEGFYVEGTFKWMKELGFKGTIEDIYKVIGTTMEDTYKILYEFLHGKIEIEDLKHINETYFAVNELPFCDVLMSGVKETLIWLKENKIQIAVCSSSPYNTIKTVLRETEIEQYFDFITSGEEFVQSKPNPEIYLTAAQKLGVDIEECLVVEDSTLGIKAGKNANMKVVAIQDKRFNLKQDEADIIVNTMDDVLSLLKQGNI